MAAPLGFKTFVTGEVLTAADTNGYLMQGIWTFNNAAARDAAVTAPVEGNTCYLKDTDVIQVYSGTAWVTKSGASPLTTKGDLYTYSTTDARLGVGANDTVLTADSTAATGLKWAAPSTAVAISQIATGTFASGTSLTLSSLSNYDTLTMVMNQVSVSSAGSLYFRINNNSGSNYVEGGWSINGTTTSRYDYMSGDTGILAGANAVSNTFNSITLRLQNCKATGFTNYFMTSIVDNGTKFVYNIQGVYKVAEAVSSLVFLPTAGSFNATANYTLYGG